MPASASWTARAADPWRRGGLRRGDAAPHARRWSLNTMDTILYEPAAGAISFYMTIARRRTWAAPARSARRRRSGSTAGGRAHGRGFTLDQFMDQCYSNVGDLGKGRQMPVHYGSRALNFHTISSPLATQMPQVRPPALRRVAHTSQPSAHATRLRAGAGCWRGVRAEAARRGEHCGVLLRRGRRKRGRRARGIQLRVDAAVPRRLLLPQQWLRHLDADEGPGAPRQRIPALPVADTRR